MRKYSFTGEPRGLLMTIAFKGCAYHGFQVQKNALSVCEVFQTALHQVLKEPVQVKGCSRTDTGVHANQYCISFVTRNPIACDRLVAAMNVTLPADIAALHCREVPVEFHARYDCVAKEYLYQICNRREKDPFLEGLALHYPYPLDAQLLDRAAQAFVGRHDFAAFCNDREETDTVRTVYAFSVCRQGDMVTLRVLGDGFLYNMVRILVGTLLQVARGRTKPDELPRILQSRDRSQAGPTAVAQGLYLNRIFYETLEEANCWERGKELGRAD